MKTTIDQYTKLADIAFAFRYFNMTDEEEDAAIPAPYGYENVPQPVSKASHQRIKFGRNPDRLTYIETVETFADGSSFATS